MQRLKNKFTQCQIVLKTFQERSPAWVGGIEFLSMYPAILQYHARIKELEAEGYEFEGRWKEGQNYMEYRLKPKETLF